MKAKAPLAVGVGKAINVVEPSEPTPPMLMEASPWPKPGMPTMPSTSGTPARNVGHKCSVFTTIVYSLVVVAAGAERACSASVRTERRVLAYMVECVCAVRMCS